jgi:nucleotide-binding universal stress UspA family protein
MSNSKDLTISDGKEIINPDGNVISGNVLSNNDSKTNEFNQKENDSISKDNLPHFKKILVTDDGKDLSNKAINYSVYLSNSTGADLFILRILEDVDTLKDINIEGTITIPTNDNNIESTNQNFKRSIKGNIIDSMENKIKQCMDAGCTNKVSYKFLAGNNAVDEIVTEIKNENYDLIVLSTIHIDSWFKSLFSDTRKIISHMRKPVLVIQ